MTNTTDREEQIINILVNYDIDPHDEILSLGLVKDILAWHEAELKKLVEPGE